MRMEIITVLVAGCIILLVAGESPGAVVADTFTAADNTTLEGRTPSPDDLPGGTWSIRTPWLGSARQFEVQSNTVVVSSGNAFIDVGDAGAYVKPSGLTISADVRIGNIDGNPTSDGRVRGVAVGFFATAPPTGNVEPDQKFQGVYLSYRGSIYLRTWDDVGPWTTQYGVTRISPVSGTEPTWGTTAYWSSYNSDASGTPSDTNFGAFDKDAAYTISYDVNTVSGDISDVTITNSLGASLYYDPATTTFTDSNTDLAAFASSSMSTDEFHLGRLDDFVLMVPEPGTLALLGLGGLATITRRQRRRI